MKCKHTYRTWQLSQQHRNRGDLRVDVQYDEGYVPENIVVEGS